MTFPSVHPALGRALVARGYSVPTAVQLAVLEADTSGRDLLVSAQTGSGKTVAFGLAMAPTLLGEAERLPEAAEPLALIIAPTRELAMQVQRELAWLYGDTGARIVTCVGGMDGRAEARQLGYGAHIVVGTPGRLRDHLERQRLDLSKLKVAVLDEADEMLDLGFREDLEFILDTTPADRQTLLFSATMPREIETLARRYQRDSHRIETLRRNEQHADIEYHAMRVAPRDIENAVVNVLRLHEMRATLVFCATRESVKRLHARLVERGFSAVALSGELNQNERTHALQALRDGRARVLVATDVAARGLDLPDLALVIHADLPNDRETLLHRSGRTGRAGNKGRCVLIVPFNRRRKADALLAAAKLKVTWSPAPTVEEIRARDQERFLADPIFTDAATDEDVKLARVLQDARTADEIALALVRIYRGRLPEPEELTEDTGPPRREDRAPREWSKHQSDRPRAREDQGSEFAPRDRRPPRPPRDHGRAMVWFRINIGRERNADPRWLLPLICRAGDVTKAEIGAIKIFDRDTRFEIAAEVADNYEAAARSMKSKEGQISRVGDSQPGSVPFVADETHKPQERPERKFKAAESTDPDAQSGPTKPWVKRDKLNGGKPHRKNGRPEGQGSRFGASRPGNAPFVADETTTSSERPERRFKAAASPDSDAQSRPKKPWVKRDKPNGGSPHRKNGGPRQHGHGPRPHSAGPKSHGAHKPASKHGHKKKHRATHEG